MAEAETPSTPERSAVPGAGGVVFDEGGRVLVLRQAAGPWVFPKGHIDPGESALEAALREVEEEAAVVASCPEPGFQQTTRYLNSRGEWRVVTWFLLQAQGGQPRPEAIFSEAEFVAPEVALRRLSFEEDRALLAAMLARRRW